MEHSTVATLLRTTQALCGQLCEKETLDRGIAFFSERFASLPQVNQFREVLVEEPAEWPAVFERTEAWFGERGLVCHRWAPALGADREAMCEFLRGRGFHQRSFTAMVLTRWVQLEHYKDVRVLPARAMRAAFRGTFVEPGGGEAPPISATAYEDRMDDSSFDVFVALIDREPVGRCALLQVGDIVRIMDLTVLPRFEGKGVESALTISTLSLAKRIAPRTVCLQLDARDAQQREWFERAGFEDDGTIVEFHRDTDCGSV